MKPELFHIAGLTIYGYGFCILVGVIAAFFHLYLNRVRLGMDVDSISTVILICFVGVFLGGKVFIFGRPCRTLVADGSVLRGSGQWICLLWVVFGHVIDALGLDAKDWLGFLG